MGIFGSSAKSKIQKIAAKKERVSEVERLKYIVSSVDKAAEEGYFQATVVVEKQDLKKVINELLKEKFGIVYSDPVRGKICMFVYWGPSSNKRSKFYGKTKEQWVDEIVSELETVLGMSQQSKFNKNFDGLSSEDDLNKARNTLSSAKVSWAKVIK